MLENLSVVLVVSTILGFLAGIGIGGGSLLIMWLTLMLNMPHSDARVLNLLFFLPSALIATVFRWRDGHIDIKSILPAIFAGCIAAIAGTLFSFILDVQVLKKLFGFLLLITGTREL